MEILPGQERGRRDYAEGANPYFLVTQVAKRLGGIRLSSCFPALCKLLQPNSQYVQATLPLLDGVWIYIPSYSFYSSRPSTSSDERPVTATHLHHGVPSVHGSAERHFPETASRRALPCLWDHPRLIQGSQEVCCWVRKFQTGGEMIHFCLRRQLSMTPPCLASGAHGGLLAWLASLQPESSSSLTSGDHCSHSYVFLVTWGKKLLAVTLS